jgi:hypothetical protein
MVPMSFVVQGTPAQPLAPYVESVWFCRNPGNRCATSGCSELDGQSDWCRIQARTSRSTSVTRRSRLVSHALCSADVPDGQTYLPMRGGRCSLFRVPSRTGCQVSLRSMRPNPRIWTPPGPQADHRRRRSTAVGSPAQHTGPGWSWPRWKAARGAAQLVDAPAAEAQLCRCTPHPAPSKT